MLDHPHLWPEGVHGGSAANHVGAFLVEATTPSPLIVAGLGADQLYGLYISWCTISRVDSLTEDALWAALGERGIAPGENSLTMTGPAAADYILESYPVSA